MNSNEHDNDTPDAGAAPAPAATTRAVVRARLSERLAAAEAETNPAKILVESFKAQWAWMGVEDGQPVELQQLAPKAPDEEVGAALRATNRRDPSKGEYRHMNRYARVHGLREALKLLNHAAENFQSQGLYVIANRLKKAVADKAKVGVWLPFSKDGGTTDGDIAARAVVMLDIDPRREDGVKDISATGEERKRANERALDLYADLVEILGSDQPLALVSSGNGAQVHVRVDLANTLDATGVVRRLLLVLDQLYSSDTEELDTAVFDAKRLFPACGTSKRKGASNPASGRVHRPSLFLPGVDTPDVLSADAVARLLATFEGRLTGDQRAVVDADMRTPGARPAAGATKTSWGTDAGGSSFTKANAISVGEVVRKLGLDPQGLACPACGATSNVDSLERKGINVIKCPHATCGSRSWGPVSLVAKVAFGCDDLKGTKGVAAQVLGWFGDNFGLEIKRSTKTAGRPTAEQTADSDARYTEMIAELGARASSRGGSGHTPGPGPATQGGPPEGEREAVQGEPARPALSDAEIDERLRAVVGRSALEHETAVNAVHADTGKTKGALRARLKELAAEKVVDAGDGAGGEDTKASVLGEVMSTIRFVQSTNSRVFALFGAEAIPADSSRLRARIARLFHERSGGALVSDTTISTALLPVLGGNIPQGVVPIRYAHERDGAILVDLGDRSRLVVRIRHDACELVDESPMSFFRPDGLRPLPRPAFPTDDAVCKAVFEEAQTFLGVTRAQLAADFIWMLGAMRPMEPATCSNGEEDDDLTEYVILKIVGGEGSGKSGHGKYVRASVDPRRPDLVAMPKDLKDISIGAENTRVLAYDNLSWIDHEHSDALCRVSTGDGAEVRALYTPRGSDGLSRREPRPHHERDGGDHRARPAQQVPVPLVTGAAEAQDQACPGQGVPRAPSEALRRTLLRSQPRAP